MPLFASGTSSNKGDPGCPVLLFFARVREGRGRARNRGEALYKPRLKLRARKKSLRVKPSLAFLSLCREGKGNGSFTAADCLCRGFAIVLPQGQVAGRYTKL